MWTRYFQSVYKYNSNNFIKLTTGTLSIEVISELIRNSNILYVLLDSKLSVSLSLTILDEFSTLFFFFRFLKSIKWDERKTIHTWKYVTGNKTFVIAHEEHAKDTFRWTLLHFRGIWRTLISFESFWVMKCLHQAPTVAWWTCLEQHVISAHGNYFHPIPVGLNDWNCFYLLVE